MDDFKSEAKLQIKKDQEWELWLISPSRKDVLGTFNTLDELNQAQITLYKAWERPRLYSEAGPEIFRS